MKINPFVLSLLILISIYAPAFGQIAKIDSMLRSSSFHNQFSGSVLLAKNEKIIYEKVLGQANESKKIPISSKTPFSIASIGKVFTAALILKLVEEGKLELTDPIQNYLPKSLIPNANKITIEHLLTHTSGLGNYMAHPQYATLITRRITIKDVMPLIAEQALVFDQPGARFEYSNSGYVLLGKIIETITGKSYENVLKETILSPLSLSFTQLSIDREDSKELAVGYVRTNLNENWTSTWSTFPTPLSDGGIFTNTTDLYKFDQALFSGRIIKLSTLTKMMTVYAESSQPGLGKMLYGYGMMLTEKEGNVISAGHNGGSPGYGAEYRHYTINNQHYTLIIQTNHDRVLRPIFSQIHQMILNGNI